MADILMWILAAILLALTLYCIYSSSDQNDTRVPSAHVSTNQHGPIKRTTQNRNIDTRTRVNESQLVRRWVRESRLESNMRSREEDESSASIQRYRDWMRQYEECESDEVERRRFCEKKVIVIKNICGMRQLWYLKDDNKLQVPGTPGSDLSEIWLSHGPTWRQLMDLMEHFKLKYPKPTLFIGRLVGYTSQDMEGLEKLERNGFILEIWKQESDKVHESYARYLRNFMCILNCGLTENGDKVIKIACAELKVTHITTDSGNLYRSDYNKHAEKMLIRDTNPQDVGEIWINNSPCEECSNELVNHFKNEIIKPIIYVGKLYAKDPDGIGIGLLVANRFTVRPWREYIKYTGRSNVKNTYIFKKIEEFERTYCEKIADLEQEVHM